MTLGFLGILGLFSTKPEINNFVKNKKMQKRARGETKPKYLRNLSRPHGRPVGASAAPPPAIYTSSFPFLVVVKFSNFDAAKPPIWRLENNRQNNY
jgi:hypothetical protein